MKIFRRTETCFQRTSQTEPRIRNSYAGHLNYQTSLSERWKNCLRFCGRVFVLRDVEGLPIAQTAQTLNLTQAAVRAWLLRVRLNLRKRLNRYFDERTTLAPEAFAPTGRVTKKIIGLFAEYLRDSIPRIYSTSF